MCHYRSLRLPALLILLLLLALLSSGAQAQVIYTLSAVDVSVPVSATDSIVHFSATVLNTGATALSFVDGSGSIAGLPLLEPGDLSPLDDTNYGNNFLLHAPLQPGDPAYTAPIFDVTVAANTPVGAYPGQYTITFNNGGSDFTRQANFTLDVAPAAPEPALPALLVGLSVLGCLLSARKRQIGARIAGT